MNVRERALAWLVDNVPDWPDTMDLDVSARQFANFRFVRTIDRSEVVFGNGLVPGITKQEWESAL